MRAVVGRVSTKTTQCPCILVCFATLTVFVGSTLSAFHIAIIAGQSPDMVVTTRLPITDGCIGIFGHSANHLGNNNLQVVPPFDGLPIDHDGLVTLLGW